MNEPTVTTTKPLIDLDNTAIAITIMITIGILGVYKTYTDAKYNRETFCTYDEKGFYFASRPVTANTTAVCPA